MSSDEKMDTSEVEIPSVEASKLEEKADTIEEKTTNESEETKEVEDIVKKPLEVVPEENGLDDPVKMTEATPKKRSRPKLERASAAKAVSVEAATPGKRGRKRKNSTTQSPNSTRGSEVATPARKGAKVQPLLSYKDFAPSVIGTRVLSCGEGDALGHPGRSTTKKPRKVDIVEEEDLQVVQVIAGGVHSAFLTSDGDVYMCGINEKGTVPAEGVESEGSTDEFTKVNFSDDIKKEGKIVMLAAGASFTAGVTEKGSVVAWGNLRNSNGEVDVHPLLHKMQEHPVVIVHHKLRTIVKIAAGENHLVMLDEKGEVLTFGDGEMGQLGRSSRTKTIRSKFMCDESGSHLVVPLRFRQKSRFYDVAATNVFASGFWTIIQGDDGNYYSFGLNNYGQLGTKLSTAESESLGENGQDNRELRVFLPAEAAAYGVQKNFANIEGVQHVVALSDDGEVYVMGKNTDNALGLGNWTGKDDQDHWIYNTLAKLDFEGNKISGVSAKLATSFVWTEDGDAYAWGFDTTGQLGLGLKDDDEKMVSTPEKVSSAHLDGFRIIGASISDQHTLILAAKK